jgi:hypothetical protein
LNLFMPAMPVSSTDLNRSQWMSVQKWTGDDEAEGKAARRPNILLGSRATLEDSSATATSPPMAAKARDEDDSSSLLVSSYSDRDALYLYVDLSESTAASVEAEQTPADMARAQTEETETESSAQVWWISRLVDQPRSDVVCTLLVCEKGGGRERRVQQGR